MTEPDARAVQDAEFMRRALDLASRGWGQTAPNPMVGAVIVRDGVIIGEGFHARYGDAHAETAALGRAGDATGATVYVSLEPCAHFGKTPPCADALIEAGVSRVVVAVEDPSLVARGGIEKLRRAGITVDVGVRRDEAWELNAPFFHAVTSDRPWVTLKLAVSLDAAIADSTGRPSWITNQQSRDEVHRLRAGVDAIAVGIGTALADDPMLTPRGAITPRVQPARVVLDRRGRLSVSSRLVASAREAPVILVTQTPDEAHVAALRAAGVDIEIAPTLRDGLLALRRRNIRSLLVEGGAIIAGALLGDALVDRLVIFQAPVILGHGALNAFAYAPPAVAASVSRMRVVERKAFGDDLMTVLAP
jgi:diaminohydroxyphosphoribosylaminopyrimidine deaminase / 5-amino-6-(5-phosphoribosylamino)uracil reductase